MGKKFQKNLTAAERALILRMYAATAPVKWLAEHFNRDPVTIQQIIKKAGAHRGRVHKLGPRAAPTERILREAGLLP